MKLMMIHVLTLGEARWDRAHTIFPLLNISYTAVLHHILFLHYDNLCKPRRKGVEIQHHYHMLSRLCRTCNALGAREIVRGAEAIAASSGNVRRPSSGLRTSG